MTRIYYTSDLLDIGTMKGKVYTSDVVVLGDGEYYDADGFTLVILYFQVT